MAARERLSPRDLSGHIERLSVLVDKLLSLPKQVRLPE